MIFCKDLLVATTRQLAGLAAQLNPSEATIQSISATVCRTPSRKVKCCSTTSKGYVRVAACMRRFALLCENTDHLLDLRPPALSIEIQAPVGEGLEWDSKCPRDLAHSMADLLLL